MAVQGYLPNFEPPSKMGKTIGEYIPDPSDELRHYTPIAPMILTETIKAPTGTPFPDFSELDEEVPAPACDLENVEYCEACQ